MSPGNCCARGRAAKREALADGGRRLLSGTRSRLAISLRSEVRCPLEVDSSSSLRSLLSLFSADSTTVLGLDGSEDMPALALMAAPSSTTGDSS